MKYSTALGPFFYANWKASQKEEFSTGYEVPLYTDARLTGMIEEGYGPYQFLNTMTGGNNNEPSLTPNLILRTHDHLEWKEYESYETNEVNYHGGLLQDEAAALLSLCMGVRFRAVGISRYFSVSHPIGMPIGWDNQLIPNLKYIHPSQLRIPNAVGQHSLDDISPLKSLPLLSAEAAGVLIKSARLYQHALWICESEPELSWLFFVSAIETAANFWRRKKASSVERLCAARPALEKILVDAGGQELLQKVAKEIADFMGATQKFLDFMLTFLPNAPQGRPYEWAQHPWDKEAWKPTLRKIYEYRSRALHAGLPFPAPMCFAAMKLENAYAEKPYGIASGTGSHQWNAEDLPLHLHTFEYIVRGVLLNWWASLTPKMTT